MTQPKKVISLETMLRMKRVDVMIKENIKKQALVKRSQQKVRETRQEEQENKREKLRQLQNWQAEKRKHMESKEVPNRYGWWVDQRRMKGTREKTDPKCKCKS